MSNQVVKDKMAREIMVIPTKEVFLFVNRKNGLLPPNEDLLNHINSNYQWMVRGEAEENPEFKQPIPYGVLINSQGEVFLYKRWGKNSTAGEKRLHEKLSIGVGGHVEKKDVGNSQDPLTLTFQRELEEEIGLKPQDIDEIKLIGFVNDDSNEVGKVHLGIVFLVKVKDDFKPVMSDGELQSGEFVSPQEIKKSVEEWGDMETWSQIILNEYF